MRPVRIRKSAIASNRLREPALHRAAASCEHLESRRLLSTVAMPAPVSGTDYGPLLRASVDQALRETGDAVVTFQAGNYLVNPTRVTWDFSSASDLTGYWNIINGTGAVSGGNLTITPTAGFTDVRIELKTEQPLGIGAFTLLADFVTVPANSKVNVGKRSQGETSQLTPLFVNPTIPLVTGTSSFGVTASSGKASVFQQTGLKFQKNDGSAFTASDKIVISSLRVRISPTGTGTTITDNDIAARCIADVDTTGVSSKNYSLLGSTTGTTELDSGTPFTAFLGYNGPNCLDFTLSNINFDFNSRPFVQGKIVSSLGSHSWGVQFDTAADQATATSSDWIALQEGSGSTAFYELSIRDATNPSRIKTTVHEFVHQLVSGSNFTGAGPTYTMATTTNDANIAVNDRFVLTTRDAGLTFFSSAYAQNITVQNVNIYKSPGSGFSLSNMTGKVVFDSVNIAPKSTDFNVQYISQPADGIHINSSQYKADLSNPSDRALSITNCRIEGNLDDGIALYQSGFQVTGWSSSTPNVYTVSVATAMPRSGDTVVVYGASGDIRGTSTVTGVTSNTITLADALTGITVSTNTYNTDFIYNLSRNFGNHLIQSTTIIDNRGDGVMTRASDGTINNCTFTRNSHPGVYIGNGQWSTGAWGGNETISNCAFNDCNNNVSSYQLTGGTVGTTFGAGSLQAIFSGRLNQIATPGNDRALSGLTIHHCNFSGYHRAAINLTAVQNVTIDGNGTITGNAADATPSDGTSAPIILTNVGNLALSDTTINDSHSASDADIDVDPYIATGKFPSTPPSDKPRVYQNVVFNLTAPVKAVSNSLFEDNFNSGLNLSTWTSLLGTWSGVSGQASRPGPGGEGVLMHSAAWTDFTASTTLKMTASSGSSPAGAGLAFRMTDINNFYWLDVDYGQQAVRLMRKQANSWTTLQTVPFTVALNTAYRITIDITGKTINAAINGANVISNYVDTPSTLNSGGVGFRVFGTSALLDDVLVQ
jgi:hypothetical protein